jgi:hypothetical protein
MYASPSTLTRTLRMPLSLRHTSTAVAWNVRPEQRTENRATRDRRPADTVRPS